MYTKKFKPNQNIKTNFNVLQVDTHFIDQLNCDIRRNQAPQIQCVKFPSDLKSLLLQATYVPNDPTHPLFQQYYKVQMKYKTYPNNHILILPTHNLMFHIKPNKQTLITYFELSKKYI